MIFTTNVVRFVTAAVTAQSSAAIPSSARKRQHSTCLPRSSASIKATMLKTRIIPCLDVKDGRVVKGVNFVDLQDAGDPVEQAKVYDRQGADELCFLDISASSDNRNILYDTVASVAERCFMPLTVGGGVRT